MSKRRKPADNAVITSVDRIRNLLDDSIFYDPDAVEVDDEFRDDDSWSGNDLIVPGLRNVQKFINKQETSALGAVKEIREEEKNERMTQIKEYDIDGSLMALYRIWSLIPPVHRMSRAELAQMLARRVIYNKDDIIAINKPYGLSSKFSITEDRLSVQSALGELRPLIAPKSEFLHVVHRLDKTTTGLLLLAASNLRASELRDAFERKKVEKKYWALVRNVPKPTEGIIDIPLREAKVGGRFKVIPLVQLGDNVEQLGRFPMPEDGQEPGTMDKRTPVTEYRVLSTGKKCALVECKARTGFKHQIRCHLGYGLGTPILGDHKYTHYLAYEPQRLPPDTLAALGIRSAKSRCMPVHLHAKEGMQHAKVAILAYARPTYWISKSYVTNDQFHHLEPKKEPSSIVKQSFKERRFRLRLRLDSYLFCAFTYEFQYSPTFRHGFCKKWCSLSQDNLEDMSVIVIRLSDPPQFPLDYKWNYKIEALVNRHLELEKLMWYLSTLGGAFSALGDLAVKYAQQAGRISLEQLRIAFLLGDPITVARCRLYIAISFIQTDRLRQAKHIIRQQYRFAISCNVADNRQLKNACLGIWSKLRYAYEMRRTKRIMTDRTS